MVYACSECGKLCSESDKWCPNCLKSLAIKNVYFDEADYRQKDPFYRQSMRQSRANEPVVTYDVQSVGVGYYTKRLALIVFPLLAIAVFVTVLVSYLEKGGVSDPTFIKSYVLAFGFMGFRACALVYFLVVSIAICVKRGWGLLDPTYEYEGRDGNIYGSASLLIVLLDIIILVGVIPVAFPVSIVNSIREMAGKHFEYYEIHKIERISTIVTILITIGLVVGVILWFAVKVMGDSVVLM